MLRLWKGRQGCFAANRAVTPVLYPAGFSTPRVEASRVIWRHSQSHARCTNFRPGYMLTNLTKVILANDPALRDEWTSKIPVVSEPNHLF